MEARLKGNYIFLNKLITMKILSAFKFAVYISAVSLVFGCQKESLAPSISVAENLSNHKSDNNKELQEHKLKGEYTVGYYSFVPDIAAGYVVPSPAPGWYPGVATEGHLNLLGKSQAFINMYATFGANGLQGIAAPVNLYFANELNALGIVVPDAVAVILFDKQGNSIWARAKGTIPITPVSATRVTFNIDVVILGGTGKFVNATGSFLGSGYFNPQDTKDVGLEITDGTIVY
jgi:hypothetical protein